jgi:hypothetical protein
MENIMNKKYSVFLIILMMSSMLVTSTGCSNGSKTTTKELTSIPASFQGYYECYPMGVKIKAKEATFTKFYMTYTVAVPGVGVATNTAKVSGTYSMTRAIVSYVNGNPSTANIYYSIKFNSIWRNVPLYGKSTSGKSFTAYGYTYKKLS